MSEIDQLVRTAPVELRTDEVPDEKLLRCQIVETADLRALRQIRNQSGKKQTETASSFLFQHTDQLLRPDRRILIPDKEAFIVGIDRLDRISEKAGKTFRVSLMRQFDEELHRLGTERIDMARNLRDREAERGRSGWNRGFIQQSVIRQ